MVLELLSRNQLCEALNCIVSLLFHEPHSHFLHVSFGDCIPGLREEDLDDGVSRREGTVDRDAYID